MHNIKLRSGISICYICTKYELNMLKINASKTKIKLINPNTIEFFSSLPFCFGVFFCYFWTKNNVHAPHQNMIKAIEKVVLLDLLFVCVFAAAAFGCCVCVSLSLSMFVCEIISSMAIQWFVNISRFFCCCCRRFYFIAHNFWGFFSRLTKAIRKVRKKASHKKCHPLKVNVLYMRTPVTFFC